MKSKFARNSGSAKLEDFKCLNGFSISQVLRFNNFDKTRGKCLDDTNSYQLYPSTVPHLASFAIAPFLFRRLHIEATHNPRSNYSHASPSAPHFVHLAMGLSWKL